MKRHFLKRSLAAALSCALFVLPLSSCNSLPQSPQVPPDLSSLSDQQLYETVYFQNLDVVEAYPDEETAFAMISPVRRTLYVLSMYDTEIQNGGLCQFFVNSSRSLAPYVEECLEAVGATEHRQLYAEFMNSNGIDVHDLDSFIVSDIAGYVAQTQRYDFETFDDRYGELEPLETFLVAYIRANIEEF